METINKTYSIIKGHNNPLSCDVAIIEGKDYTYIFEAGNSERIIEELNSIDRKKIVIISHFHEDHLKNISKLNYEKLYVGDNTYKYTNKGEIVDDLYIDDGIRIHLFKINSCHAKGSIGLQINDYAFLGDATSPTLKKGHYVYNVQMLKEEIELLEKINVKYFVFSHHMEEHKDKDEVIKKLKEIYSKREKSNPYIIVD